MADDTKHNRSVAIKVLCSDIAQTVGAMVLFIAISSQRISCYRKAMRLSPTSVSARR